MARRRAAPVFLTKIPESNPGAGRLLKKHTISEVYLKMCFPVISCLIVSPLIDLEKHTGASRQEFSMFLNTVYSWRLN